MRKLRLKVLISGEWDIDLLLSLSLLFLAIGVLVLPGPLANRKFYAPMTIFISTKAGWALVYSSLALFGLLGAWHDSPRRTVTVGAMGLMFVFQCIIALQAGWTVQAGLDFALVIMASIGLFRNTTRQVNGRSIPRPGDSSGRSSRSVG